MSRMKWMKTRLATRHCGTEDCWVALHKRSDMVYAICLATGDCICFTMMMTYDDYVRSWRTMTTYDVRRRRTTTTTTYDDIRWQRTTTTYDYDVRWRLRRTTYDDDYVRRRRTLTAYNYDVRWLRTTYDDDVRLWRTMTTYDDYVQQRTMTTYDNLRRQHMTTYDDEVRGLDTCYSTTYVSQICDHWPAVLYNLEGMTQWYHDTLCGDPLPMLMDSWTCSAASRHTITSTTSNK